jgi:hypothetical protein
LPLNDVSDLLPRTLLRTGAYLLLLAALCLTLQGGNLAILMFRADDLPALGIGAVLLIALALLRPGWRRQVPAARPAWVTAAAALLVLLACRAGTHLIFGGYALTRDELCADFDATILATGRLFATIPAQWQTYSHALMPQFMLPLPPDIGWLSSYLPGNAALRALGELSLGAQWVNPLLAMVSVTALYRIALRLWPGARRTALVPVLLLATSAQFLAMAMTSYAMTAHLAVNLIWLRCFLRGDRRGDAGAIAAGFVGTGLHQLLFHPLFILPFVASLWFSKQRLRALVYVAAYAAIGLFWIFYWQLILPPHAAQGDAAGGGLAFLFSRLLTQLTSIDAAAIPLMLLNLARLLSWQSLFVLPLLVLAWPAVRRGDGIARPLAAGILLLFLAMLILLPWQGHGWGYRYMHGFLGSLCLLAGYGWTRVAGTEERQRLYGAFAAATAASLLVLLPLHLAYAHRLAAPYRTAYEAIARAPAEVVLVDRTGLFYADDLVRNRPDLSNRPLVMDLDSLTAAQIADLCRSRSVARFGFADGMAAGIMGAAEPASARSRLLDRLSCGIPVPR